MIVTSADNCDHCGKSLVTTTYNNIQMIEYRDAEGVARREFYHGKCYRRIRRMVQPGD